MSRTMINPCGFNYVLTFGKYKGQNVEDVIDKDPQYINWLVEEEILMIKPRVENYLQEKLNEKLEENYGWGDWQDMF